MRLRTFAVLVLGVMLAVGAVPARADIVPVLISIMPTGSGTFLWTYDASVIGGSKVSPLGSVPGTATPVDNTRSIKDYLTLYDFSGFVTATVPAGYAFQSLPVGSTPDGVNVPGASDLGSIPNLTIYKILTTTEPPCCSQPGPSVFVFSVESEFGEVARTLSLFSSNTTKDAVGDPSNNTDLANTGFTESPFQLGGCPPFFHRTTSCADVPEPHTVLLMVSGLIALGIYRRRQG